MNELAVYIVKPEAMASRDAIRREIENAGFSIVGATVTCLDSQAIDEIYPGLSPELRQASVRFLCDTPVEIAVVSHKRATRELVAFAGESVNPCDCAPGTLRRRYGRREPDTSFGRAYFFNAVHRSSCSVDAEREVRVFERLSGKRVSQGVQD